MNTTKSILGIVEKNNDSSVYVGNLDPNVTEELLWELMIQVGPVQSVRIHRDPVTNEKADFGFVTFQTPQDAEYSMLIMKDIKIYGKPLRMNWSEKETTEIAPTAKLFIGNLSAEVDEELLDQIFSNFGNLVQDSFIVRDVETNESKGHGFVFYDDFICADRAIEKMNGQYVRGQEIIVEYAFKDDKKSIRHGSAAERFLASRK
eukprot:TRINITY_DN432_c0_g1_i1.p1 TRINITY_DN432_c0_g1~~TRINITY_DN432_c0_g1_i1.p1  ORF type:complete len:204 (+),score=64.83 TRINITY_DN432_c0_g1_i1:54-665(+)